MSDATKPDKSTALTSFTDPALEYRCRGNVVYRYENGKKIIHSKVGSNAEAVALMESLNQSSVTPVTEVLYPTIEYETYTPEQLHQANLEIVRTAKDMNRQFGAFLQNRMLPAFRATIDRLKKPGQRMNGQSDVENYFKSIGLTYANVRKMFSREKKRLLEGMGYQKKPRGERAAKLEVPENRTELYAEQGLKVCDLLCSGDVKAAHGLAKRMVEAAADKPLVLNGADNQEIIAAQQKYTPLRAANKNVQCMHYNERNAAGRGIPKSRCPNLADVRISGEHKEIYCEDHAPWGERRDIRSTYVSQEALTAAWLLLRRILREHPDLASKYPESKNTGIQISGSP